MILGVIGGLGPMATARFMEMVTEMTDALCDQEHLEMLVHNCPAIPDRTAYILGKSEKNPVTPMIKIGCSLAAQGAAHIAIPCITAHYFFEQMSETIPVPIINAVEETTGELKRHGVCRAGIMATDGTVHMKLFQKELEESGIDSVVPEEKYQKYIMDVIYKNIKQNLPPDMDKFREAERNLRQNGAEVIILGCTELSLVNRNGNPGSGFLDAMAALARRSVVACGKGLKSKYNKLITE